MNSFLNRIPPVTKNLLVINIIIWLATELLPGTFDATLSRYCALHYFSSPNFSFWQPITYMFMHGNFTHLLFNMFAVWMFGSVLERVFGSSRYLLFYMTCGVGAALIQEGVYAIWLHHLGASLPSGMSLSAVIDESINLWNNGRIFVQEPLSTISTLVNVPTVGASGALYGILLGFAMIFPNMPLYFFFIPVPIKAKWMVLAYGVIELFYGVTGLQSGVAHFAHLGGMIVAFLLIIYWRNRGEINRDPLY